MKKLYLSAFLMCTILSIPAQEIIWERNIKSSTQDFLSQVITTIDQQYLVSGSSLREPQATSLRNQATSVGSGSLREPQGTSGGSAQGTSRQNNGFDFHLVKLNQQGDQVWEKYFAGNNHDYLTAAVTTQDGGHLLAGTSYSGKGLDKKEDSKGGSDIWLIRLNEFGDELWQKTLGTLADEEARAAIQTTDLGFFVAGNVQGSLREPQGTPTSDSQGTLISNSRGTPISDSQGTSTQEPQGTPISELRETSTHETQVMEGFGSKDVWIIKLDKNGKEISQLVLGGSSLDEVEKMIPTRDGGALLGIYSRSSEFLVSGSENQNSTSGTSNPVSRYPKNTNNEGEGDYWLVKLDKSGKVEWEKNYGGKGDDHLRTLALTSTGYIIGGESRSERSGNKTVGIEEGTDVWLISLNERGDEQWQKSYNFKNRDILMGMSVIHSADDKTKGVLLGGYTQAEGRIEANDETFWMLYLDHAGNEQWRKHVKGESRKREERLSDIKLNRDGSIILAGTSAEELGKENWKIIKLGDQQLDQLIEKQNIKIYPNPVSDYAYVEIGFDPSTGSGQGFKDADITLYDMGGRQLQSLKTKNKVTKINTQSLIQGAYLVTVKTDGNKTASAKLIKK